MARGKGDKILSYQSGRNPLLLCLKDLCFLQLSVKNYAQTFRKFQQLDRIATEKHTYPRNTEIVNARDLH